MSADLLAQSIKSSAQRHIINSAQAAQEVANDAVGNYNRLKKQWNSLVERYEAQGAELEKVKENANRMAELYKKANDSVGDLNSQTLALWEDRERCYKAIEQLTAVIREIDDAHPVLKNPNAVLARVQQGSRDAMQEAYDLSKSGQDKQFSTSHDEQVLIEMRDKRESRANAFNDAAEKNIVTVIDPDNYKI